MFGKLSIGARFTLASILLCALTALLAFTGYRQIANLRDQIDDIPELLEVRLTMAEWQGETSNNVARAVAILRSEDPKLGDALAVDIKPVAGRINELQKRIEALPMSEESRKRFAAVAGPRAAYVAARDDTLKLKAKSPDAANVSF